MKIKLTLLALLFSTFQLNAEEMAQYEVSITNATYGQTFTPQLLATHNSEVGLFTLGQPAGEALELIAEAGDTGPLTEVIEGVPDFVGFVLTTADLLTPGQTVTVMINAKEGHDRLTLAAMLLPTNDTFVSLNSVKLPEQGSMTYRAMAYDAGTEENDQSCLHIPGPHCGGEGEAHSPVADGDEGFIYISNGIHSHGDLDPKMYDWRGPVAHITIKKLEN